MYMLYYIICKAVIPVAIKNKLMLLDRRKTSKYKSANYPSIPKK